MDQTVQRRYSDGLRQGLARVAKKLSHWLHRISTGWVTLAALAIFLVFTATVLPSQAAQAEVDSSGAPSPDTSFIYTAKDLYAMAEAYGPEGRSAYIRTRFTFDLVWPIVYLAFLAMCISRLTRRGFPQGSRWLLVNLVPVAATALDYLENVSAALVVGRYPAQTPVVDGLVPVFTFLKWLGVGGSFVLLLVMLGAAIWNRIRPHD